MVRLSLVAPAVKPRWLVVDASLLFLQGNNPIVIDDFFSKVSLVKGGSKDDLMH